MAKRHRRFIDFGYVSLSSDNSATLANWLDLPTHVRTAILVYKEQSAPVFSKKVCYIWQCMCMYLFNSPPAYQLMFYGVQQWIIDY